MSEPIRIHGIHSATLFQGHHRDESHHIAKLVHIGQLPVVAVSTVANGPDNEGTRHARLEPDSDKAGAITKCPITNVSQRLWYPD